MRVMIYLSIIFMQSKDFLSQGKQKSILLALMGIKYTYERGGFNHWGQCMVTWYSCLRKTHIMKFSLYQRGRYLLKNTFWEVQTLNNLTKVILVLGVEPQCWGYNISHPRSQERCFWRLFVCYSNSLYWDSFVQCEDIHTSCTNSSES